MDETSTSIRAAADRDARIKAHSRGDETLGEPLERLPAEPPPRSLRGLSTDEAVPVRAGSATDAVESCVPRLGHELDIGDLAVGSPGSFRTDDGRPTRYPSVKHLIRKRIFREATRRVLPNH